MKNRTLAAIVSGVSTWIACGSVASALQSGEPGFGWNWVRSNELSLQGLSWDPQHWNVTPYMEVGFNTISWHPANTYTMTMPRPPEYTDIPWHGYLIDASAGFSRYETIRNIPHNVAYIIADEPFTTAMPSFVPLLDHVRANEPNKLIYSTVSSNYASPATLHGGTPPAGYTYEQHVEDFINILKPDVLSYDHYPFYSNGTTSQIYLQNMMIIRAKAQEHGLPYWAYLQGFGNTWGRAPSESDNRFNVFTHLTAGYTGFNYWTYDYAGGAGTDDGLRDINGQATDLYYIVQQTNKEAKNLGTVMRFLESTDVRFIPGKRLVAGFLELANPTPAGLTNWTSRAGGDTHILNVAVDHTLPGNYGLNRDGMIGFFTDDDGEQYFMLTNLYHDAGLSAVSASLRFTITFDASVTGLYLWNRETATQEYIPLTSNTLVWALKGGTGDLFKYTTSNFSIVPEPAGVVGAMMACGCLTARRRRND